MTHHMWDSPLFRRTLIILVIIVLAGLTIKIVNVQLTSQTQNTLSPSEMAILDLDKYNLSVELRILLNAQLTFPLQEVDMKVTSNDPALMSHAEEIKKYLTDQGFVVNGPTVLKGNENASVEDDLAITFVPTTDTSKIELIVNGVN